MRFKRFIILLTVAFLIVSIVVPLTSCEKPTLEVVALDSGKIQGTLINGVWTYLGVPFAAPPVGDLRWREPQPVKPWEGIRVCDKFGSACPQPPGTYDIGPTSEDCLFLNVWSPAKNSGENLPVMVFIHGGTFVQEASSEPKFYGENLAKQNVIVVTINYRLGPLGFFSHPLLSKESQHGVSGNYGLLDQIYALKWVHKNIKAFGGDSNLVTVFGESAGAFCIIDLLISPLADGLFQRAISESGAFGDAYPKKDAENTVAKAEKTGLDLAAKLGCDKADDVLGCMRQKTADELVTAAFTGYEVNTGLKFRPVIDGWVIPDSPWSLFTAGKQKKVPLLIGTNADEGTYLALPNPKVLKMSPQDYEEFVKSLYGDNAADVLAQFPAANKSDIPKTYSKLLTIMSFAAGAMHAADTTAANGSRVYMYKFTRIPNTPLKVLGAYHSLELYYVFNNMHSGINIPDNEIDTSLSQNMMKYWTNFARTGDPNGPELPNWPVYSAATGQYIELGDKIAPGTGLYNEYRGLIDEVTQQ